MEARKIFCFVYCFLVIVAPDERSTFLDIFQTVTFFLSFLQFYFFRAYTASGQAQTKTVLHGLIISLTYAFQGLLVHSNALAAFRHFRMTVEILLKNYPDVVCSLATPKIFILAISIYLLCIGVFRLFMEVDSAKYMRLDHEAVVQRLNLVTLVITVLIPLLEFLFRGTICNPVTAVKLIYNRIGIKVEPGTFVKNKFPVDIVVVLMVATLFLAAVCYIASIVLKGWKYFGNPHRAKAQQQQLANKPKIEPALHRRLEVKKGGDNAASLSPTDVAKQNPAAAISAMQKKETIGEKCMPALETIMSKPTVTEAVENLKVPVTNIITVEPKNTSTSINIQGVLGRKASQVEQQLTSSGVNEQIMDGFSNRKSIPLATNSSLHDTVEYNQAKAGTTVKSQYDQKSNANQMPGPGEIGVAKSTEHSLQDQKFDPSSRQSLPEQTEQPEINEEKYRLIKKLFFTMLFVIFIISYIFSKPDIDGLIDTIMAKVYRCAFICMPMYWVLMIDDCYALTKRRILTILANVCHIYIDH